MFSLKKSCILCFLLSLRAGGWLLVLPRNSDCLIPPQQVVPVFVWGCFYNGLENLFALKSNLVGGLSPFSLSLLGLFEAVLL